MIQNLPEDIIYNIGCFLTKTQKEQLSSYEIKLGKSNLYKVFAVNRIKLWYKILKMSKLLKKYIVRNLNQIFDNLHAAYKKKNVYIMYHTYQGVCVDFVYNMKINICFLIILLKSII
jgi:hypothetical protein